MVTKSLRVLCVTDGTPPATGTSFFRAFRSLGHEAILFDESKYSCSVGFSFLNRIRARVTRPYVILALRTALLRAVTQERPDVVFISKGIAYDARTIALIARVSVVVNFTNDDISNTSIFTRNAVDALREYHLIATPRTFAVDELKHLGMRRVVHLPFGYDPELSFCQDIHSVASAPATSPAIVFVGTYFPDRAEALAELADLQLAVWGAGWHRCDLSTLRPHLRRSLVSPDEMRRIFQAARISIAFLCRNNRDRHTMRTFEIPASGGTLLAQRSPDHAAWFTEGVEADLFDSPQDLRAKALALLSDPIRLSRMRQTAWHRVTTGRHSYADRMAEVLADLGRAGILDVAHPRARFVAYAASS